ncbi:hypothetical protein NEMBOFW57_008807 [Staphylotrichum longicolle]|uniref:Uncharacterized protein n=1 Tax=Staphylotrichum longicolle TaxID=669026 RepID=A0AAD4ERV0_9PEZI|nr:hypothetical protein NEMBOFW57_008807 [Staphylotrichum longicolle]
MADENAKMTDCYYEKKDWRACKDEHLALPTADMRSHAFQALRPLRVAAPSIQPQYAQYLRAASRRSPILKQLARAASSASYTARPRTTPASTPAARAARVAPVTKKATAAPSSVNGPLDPQAAILQAATVADVDPALAAEIPTPESSASSGSSAHSPAFAAALSGNGGNGGAGAGIDWSSSFHGLSTTPFSPETAAIKPDGIIYLPRSSTGAF